MRFYLFCLIPFFSAVHLPQVHPESPRENLLSFNIFPDKLNDINDTLKTPVQDSLSSLRKKLEQFEYSSVINGANRLLRNKDQLLKKEIVETYQLKGISHFALAEDENAEKSFTEILKIDSTFNLDSSRISPKIISFFKKVKENYFNRFPRFDEENYAKVDTVFLPFSYEQKLEERVRQSVLRSLVFPGLGHLYLNGSAKGWTITALTAITAASMIYFWVDTDKKEELYINESEPGLIDYRYKKYNRSYRYRSISLIALAGIWVYSQIDLLFFSDLFEINIREEGLSFENNHIGINFKVYF